MNNRTLNVRKMTHAALIIALELLLAFTPLGYIPFLTLSITIVHLPLILGFLTEGTSVAWLAALLFGGTSWYRSLTNPSGIFSVLFANPLVSILPRLMIVPVMMLVSRCFRKNPHSKLAYGVTAASGSIANTVFVLSAVSIAITLNPAQLGLDAAAGRVMIGTVWATSMVNAGLECAAAVLLSVAIMTAYDRVYKRR